MADNNKLSVLIVKATFHSYLETWFQISWAQLCTAEPPGTKGTSPLLHAPPRSPHETATSNAGLWSPGSTAYLWPNENNKRTGLKGQFVTATKMHIQSLVNWVLCPVLLFSSIKHPSSGLLQNRSRKAKSDHTAFKEGLTSVGKKEHENFAGFPHPVRMYFIFFPTRNCCAKQE